MNLRRFPAMCAVGVAACFLAAGCGGPAAETPATVMARLHAEISKNLPKGWKVGLAKESGVDVGTWAGPDDVVIWRTEKTLLRQHGVAATEGAAEPRTPVHLFFVLKTRNFINPEEYATASKTNAAIKKTHDWWNKSVSHIPRNAKGELMPRGDEERLPTSRYNAEYPKLPPYDADFPTHYYKMLAFKVWDSRKTLEPEDRLLQQEMNAVSVAITKPLSVYREK